MRAAGVEAAYIHGHDTGWTEAPNPAPQKSEAGTVCCSGLTSKTTMLRLLVLAGGATVLYLSLKLAQAVHQSVLLADHTNDNENSDAKRQSHGAPETYPVSTEPCRRNLERLN